MIAVDTALLATMPLPRPGADGDKEDRGAVLVVAGCVEVPGAALLAGMAALRAGAGKLQLGTCRSTATALAIAMPEALVMPLPESSAGGIDPAAMERLGPALERADAVLFGPGMCDGDAIEAILPPLLERAAGKVVLLDAAGAVVLRSLAGALDGRHGEAILTPHAGEMAALLNMDKDEVVADAPAVARHAAARFGAVTVLKGAATRIATPDGRLFTFTDGCVGLGTSGSGDTLAGIIAGLAARGASALQAALWGVHLHGAAGRRLAERLGPVGFLAREIPDEVPRLLAEAENRP